MHLPRTWMTKLGIWTSRPAAFLVWALFGGSWLAVSPETMDWHAVATLATWAMTLFIQRAEHRDTQAVHAKLDEVLIALRDTSSEVSRIDQQEPEEVERFREQAHQKMERSAS